MTGVEHTAELISTWDRLQVMLGEFQAAPGPGDLVTQIMLLRYEVFLNCDLGDTIVYELDMSSVAAFRKEHIITYDEAARRIGVARQTRQKLSDLVWYDE